MSTDQVLAAQELHRLLRGGPDVAVVDVRQRAAFGAGHVSVASNVPLDEVEFRLPRVAPRRATPVVVIADEAERRDALDRISALGYTDLRVLDGGIAAWAAEGLELFTGFNTVSKGLGEYVETRYATPRISAADLKERLDAGDDVVVLDTRPNGEFVQISIPGAHNAPGADVLPQALARRASPDTLVVVNCAGRTRGIIGTQALRNAGLSNPVATLDNGTSAWTLAGFTPRREALAPAATPGVDVLERAAGMARDAADLVGVREIDTAAYADVLARRDERTTYVFDVRPHDEYVAGHLPDAMWAPGGQLVQATDEYLASRGARIVLADDAHGTRALLTASWLVQMGLRDVVVHRHSVADALVAGDEAAALPDVPVVDAAELDALLRARRVTLFDVEPPSPAAWLVARPYIDGSVVTTRSGLRRATPADRGGEPVAVTSGNGVLARWTVADLVADGVAAVALAGGTDAWRAAGLPTRDGSDQLALHPGEALPPPATLEERTRFHSSYVAWAGQVVAQLERDAIVRFVEAGRRR